MLIAGGWFGFQLLRIQAAAQHIVWETLDGSLTLTHFPLKDHSIIYAGSAYKGDSHRRWEMKKPGGTSWPLVGIKAPDPELLFAEAWIGKIEPEGMSTPAGLEQLFGDVSQQQQMWIFDTLERACKNSLQRACDAVERLPAEENAE